MSLEALANLGEFLSAIVVVISLVWWRNRPTPFTNDFSAFVEARVSGGLPDPDAARRWQEFLMTGGSSRGAG